MRAWPRVGPTVETQPIWFPVKVIRTLASATDAAIARPPTNAAESLVDHAPLRTMADDVSCTALRRNAPAVAHAPTLPARSMARTRRRCTRPGASATVTLVSVAFASGTATQEDPTDRCSS